MDGVTEVRLDLAWDVSAPDDGRLVEGSVDLILEEGAGVFNAWVGDWDGREGLLVVEAGNGSQGRGGVGLEVSISTSESGRED